MVLLSCWFLGLLLVRKRVFGWIWLRRLFLRWFWLRGFLLCRLRLSGFLFVRQRVCGFVSFLEPLVGFGPIHDGPDLVVVIAILLVGLKFQQGYVQQRQETLLKVRRNVHFFGLSMLKLICLFVVNQPRPIHVVYFERLSVKVCC